MFLLFEKFTTNATGNGGGAVRCVLFFFFFVCSSTNTSGYHKAFRLVKNTVPRYYRWFCFDVRCLSLFMDVLLCVWCFLNAAFCYCIFIWSQKTHDVWWYRCRLLCCAMQCSECLCTMWVMEKQAQTAAATTTLPCYWQWQRQLYAFNLSYCSTWSVFWSLWMQQRRNVNTSSDEYRTNEIAAKLRKPIYVSTKSNWKIEFACVRIRQLSLFVYYCVACNFSHA